MTQVNAEVVINAPVDQVAESLEAFLWADDARDEPGHEPGTTTAVRKVNARQFEEVETIDLMFLTEKATTTYNLSAAPGRKTTVTITGEIPPITGSFAAQLGTDLQAEMATGAQKWAARFEAFLAKQVQRGTEGVA